MGLVLVKIALHHRGRPLGVFSIEQVKSMRDAGVIADDTSAQIEGETEATTVGALLKTLAVAANPLPKSTHGNSTGQSLQGSSQSNENSPFTPTEITDPFGLTIDTPILVRSIPASYEYLRLLATPDHQRLQTTRVGSFETNRFPHPIDKWELRDSEGRFLYHLFVYAYAASDSKCAPQGLIYFDPIGDFKATPEGKKAWQKLLKDFKANPANRQLLERMAETRKTQEQLQELLTGKRASLGNSGCLGLIIISALAMFVFIPKNGVTQMNDSRQGEEVKARAEAGDAEAEYDLGVRYVDGDGVAKDEVESVKWFRKAAEQNYAAAQADLGIAYAKGRGVAEDKVEAVKWFRKAAEQKYAKAQSLLAVCYENGDGVAKDEVESVKWYRKAAEQGHVLAQTLLGTCYLEGRGAAKDEAEAMKWFSKAAEQNNYVAQSALGFGYATGKGVGRNQVEAYKWLVLAAEQDNVMARNNLAILKKGMTAQQIADGEMLARAFRSR